MQSPSQRQITVTAVAPVFNRKELTLQCLRSIRRLNLAGIDLRVMVVDDASPDGTGNAVRVQFPEVEVIDGDGELWYSEGTNVGIRKALERGTDYVWQINDDQVFDSEALKELVGTAERFSNSVVGSALLLWDTPHKVFQVAPVWKTLGGGWIHWYNQTVWTLPDGPFEVAQIVGNSMLVPASAYRRAGLLDSRRFPMLGDGEFSPRLKRNGFRLLIEPRSRVFCLPNTPPPRISQMTFNEKVQALFGDRRKPHNLERRLRMLCATAPTALHGVVAFVAFLVRAVTGRSHEASWGASKPEAPLRNLFDPLA